jgi:(p)ppGpp synthase/HD superfamily hydrolase
MIFEAIEYAAHAHSGQYRKETKIPYIIHPLRVGNLLIEIGSKDEVVAAGILHDTIEDTSVTYRDLNRKFGEQVAGLVQSVTEPNKGHSWEVRKQHTIDSIGSLTPDALLILCADKLDNLHSIRLDLVKYGESVWQRFSRSRQQQKWYFESLLNAMNSNIPEAGASLLEKFKSEVDIVF